MINQEPGPLHPSYLELDQLFLAARGLGAPAGSWGSHCRDCAQCQRYLETLESRAAAPLPQWIGALAQERPGLLARLRERWSRPLFLAPLLAAASLVLALAFRGSPLQRPMPEVPEGPDGPEVRAKGGPGVNVYIKRGERVTQWDGKMRLRAQDRIRLQVVGGGYAQVTVALQQPGGAQVLYAGALQPSAPTPLPVSWQVSAPGAAEILAVILSAQPLAEAARPLDVAALRRQPGIFVTELFMPKEESR